MKPLIKYRGGKYREIPHILWHIPRFRGRYVEPFFGGGALFFYLEPRRAIINDINSKLMNFYVSVRDNYVSLRKELNELEKQYSVFRQDFEQQKNMFPNSRVEDKNEELYYHLRAQFNGKEEKMFSDAALYFYINKTAYSGMIRYNALGDFNVPFGRYPHFNTQGITKDHCSLLQRTQIFNTDYSNIFNICEEDDFVFLDPPYDCTFSDYGNQEYRDGFNEEEHRRLAEEFYNLPCKALMVIGKTPLIEELYGDYIIDEYDKNYAVNIRNRFKSGATHVVVANYRKEIDDVKLYGGATYEYDTLETANVMIFEKSVEYGKNKQ